MTLTVEQQAVRARGIGSSEIAAVLGVDPYRTPFDLWALKTGKVAPPAEQEWHRRGHFLEPVIVDLYGARHPEAVFDHGATMVSAAHPFAVATPDRMVLAPGTGDQWILECKSKRGYLVQDWGESGTDAVPLHVVAQCQWQMLVTGMARVDVGLLIDGEEFREYRIGRDDETLAAMVDAGARFWAEHVQADVPPSPMDGHTVSDYLQARYRSYSDIVGAATPSADVAMERLVSVRQELKALEAEEDRLTLVLKAEVGDRKGIEGRYGRFIWTTRRGNPDYKRAAFDLGLTADQAEQYRAESFRVGRFTPVEG